MRCIHCDVLFGATFSRTVIASNLLSKCQWLVEARAWGHLHLVKKDTTRVVKLLIAATTYMLQKLISYMNREYDRSHVAGDTIQGRGSGVKRPCTKDVETLLETYL